jgi:hypothetical protein
MAPPLAQSCSLAGDTRDMLARICAFPSVVSGKCEVTDVLTCCCFFLFKLFVCWDMCVVYNVKDLFLLQAV